MPKKNERRRSKSIVQSRPKYDECERRAQESRKSRGSRRSGRNMGKTGGRKTGQAEKTPAAFKQSANRAVRAVAVMIRGSGQRAERRQDKRQQQYRRKTQGRFLHGLSSLHLKVAPGWRIRVQLITPALPRQT